MRPSRPVLWCISIVSRPFGGSASVDVSDANCEVTPTLSSRPVVKYNSISEMPVSPKKNVSKHCPYHHHNSPASTSQLSLFHLLLLQIISDYLLLLLQHQLLLLADAPLPPPPPTTTTTDFCYYYYYYYYYSRTLVL